MKSLVLLIATFGVAITAQAQIENSNYEQRHQTLLENKIYKTCEVAFGRIIQISEATIEDRVDQGVVDFYYTSEFELIVKYDQGVIDRYSVTTKSAKHDMYDHDLKDWGVYSVSSVNCKLLD